LWKKGKLGAEHSEQRRLLSCFKTYVHFYRSIAQILVNSLGLTLFT